MSDGTILGAAASLFTGGTSNILGAIIGLVGGWSAKREIRKMAELQFAHDETMARYDIEEAKAEREQALKLGIQNQDLAEMEGNQKLESKNLDAFADSIKEQGRPTGNAILDFILRLVRPIITGWLIYELHKLQMSLHELIGGLKGLDQTTLITLYTSIVDAIIFLAVTAVGWWFASRKGQTHNVK